MPSTSSSWNDIERSRSNSAGTLHRRESLAMMNTSLDTVQNLDRLASLHQTQLLATPPEADFDRFTRLAAKLLRVPVALVSLVDSDHQFFKSCFGLSEPWASARRTPLSHSFCQYVVANESVLAIEDARLDPVLKDNGAVRDLGVVAYLGSPINGPDGRSIGALCAIDGSPRKWSSGDIELISDVADAVSATIEARQNARKIVDIEQAFHAAKAEERQERRLRFVADLMPQIIWTADAAGNITYYNQQWFNYTGMSFEQTKDWGWRSVIHPDDLNECVSRWSKSVETGAPFAGEFRFKHGSDGVFRWHLSRAHPRRDESGVIVEWIGTSTDIHDHKVAEFELLGTQLRA